MKKYNSFRKKKWLIKWVFMFKTNKIMSMRRMKKKKSNPTNKIIKLANSFKTRNNRLKKKYKNNQVK